MDEILTPLYNVKVKNVSEIFGDISKDKAVSKEKNIMNNIEKVKQLQRDITVFGRILQTKIESLSVLAHVT